MSLAGSVGVARRVAARQVGDLVRRLVRELTGGRVPGRAGVVAVSVGLGVLVVLLTVSAVRTGRTLGTGYGPGLIASVASAAGLTLGMTILIGTSIWAGSTRAERERLAILPLGGRTLSLLAGLPALLPSAGALLAALPSVVALGLTTRISVTSLLGALALGLALPLSLGVMWTLPLLLLRPRRDLTVVVAVALSLGSLTGHAFWTASRLGEGEGGGWHPNPVLWVLLRSDQYSLLEGAATVSALGVSSALLVLVRRARRRQDPRTWTRRRRTTDRGARLPVAVRVWLGVVRIIWRQSSLLSEIGVAVLLSSLLCFFASVAWAQDQEVYGRTALFIAAGFGALPLLGVRSALGPTSRLVQLGMRAPDIRAGLVATGMLFHGVTLTPGLVLLLWRGVSWGQLLASVLLTVVVFCLAFSCGSLLRSVTATSLGRTVGVGVSLVACYGLLTAGLTSWPVIGMLAAAVTGVLLLWGVLRLTVRQRSIA